MEVHFTSEQEAQRATKAGTDAEHLVNEPSDAFRETTSPNIIDLSKWEGAVILIA